MATRLRLCSPDTDRESIQSNVPAIAGSCGKFVLVQVLPVVSMAEKPGHLPLEKGSVGDTQVSSSVEL